MSTTPLADDVLLTAIRDAIDRSRIMLDRKADLFELRRRYDSLSGREQEVMARVVAGHLNKRIGAALGISEITVKAHRGKVMRKMGADSVAKLVIMAMRLELPSVPTTTPVVTSSTMRFSLASLADRHSPQQAFAAAR